MELGLSDFRAVPGSRQSDGGSGFQSAGTEHVIAPGRFNKANKLTDHSVTGDRQRGD